MLTLVLLVFIIISYSKPELLISKKIKENATDEEKNIVSKNLRNIYITIILLIEGSSLISRTSGILQILGFVFAVIGIVCIVKFIPKFKENKEILNKYK